MAAKDWKIEENAEKYARAIGMQGRVQEIKEALREDMATHEIQTTATRPIGLEDLRNFFYIVAVFERIAAQQRRYPLDDFEDSCETSFCNWVNSGFYSTISKESLKKPLRVLDSSNESILGNFRKSIGEYIFGLSEEKLRNKRASWEMKCSLHNEGGTAAAASNGQS